MMHPQKTERGWELADETGTFEHEDISIIYPTKRAAQLAANEYNTPEPPYRELRGVMEGREWD